MPSLSQFARIPFALAQHLSLSLGALSLLYRRHEQHYFHAGGLKLHYSDEGRGIPIILIHGFAINSDLNWRIPGIVSTLSQHFRVITLDVRGHGLSDKPHRAAAYGEELAHDVVRLMDYLEIPQAHVVGYSMGGFITIKLMSLYPRRLLSAMPCAAGWDDLTPENVSLLGEIADALECNGTFNPLTEKLEPGGYVSPMKHALINFLLSIGNDTRALCNIFKTFRDLSVPQELLERNTVPVMAIVGMDDPLREQVEKMAEVTANMTACYVEDADHMTLATREVFAELLEDFAAQNTPAAVRPRISSR